jgi:hypothetical protein
MIANALNFGGVTSFFHWADQQYNRYEEVIEYIHIFVFEAGMMLFK